MNFEFGGTVVIGEENEDAIVCMKFGHAAWIVKEDIECMRRVESSNPDLFMISLKRKVQWRKTDMWSVPNFEQFKKRILKLKNKKEER